MVAAEAVTAPVIAVNPAVCELTMGGATLPVALGPAPPAPVLVAAVPVLLAVLFAADCNWVMASAIVSPDVVVSPCNTRRSFTMASRAWVAVAI